MASELAKIKVIVVKEGSLPPRSDHEYWDRLATAVDRLGLNSGDASLFGGELLPCPFCGGGAEFERMGTARQSCIVACQECGCRLETGEVSQCGQRWNTRSPPRELKNGQ